MFDLSLTRTAFRSGFHSNPVTTDPASAAVPLWVYRLKLGQAYARHAAGSMAPAWWTEYCATWTRRNGPLPAWDDESDGMRTKFHTSAIKDPRPKADR